MAADVAEVIYYTEDSASPVTVLKPASFASGQILIFVLGSDGGALSDFGTPSGWTALGTDVDNTGGNKGRGWSHVFNAGDPGSWDFAYNGSADVAGALIRITGADTTPTIVVTTQATGPTAGSMTGTSVTPTGSDDLLLDVAILNGGGTALVETDPTGTTDQGQAQVAGNFEAIAVASKQLSSGAATGTQVWSSITPANTTGGTFTIAVKSASAATGIPYNPQRTTPVRDPGEVWWLQRDRRDANTVATAANPLPSPLDSAWQAGGRYWHLYADVSDAAPRTWMPQQRTYYDPSLLAPPAAMPSPAPQRTVQARDYGEVQWQQEPRRDPLLLTTALLENELLGGADTAQHALTAATNAPRWWMPQQPVRQGYTPGLLDSAELEGPLLAGDIRRHVSAAAYVDRREVPQQRPYISDPSFYPTTPPTDPLTLAYGAGGTYWLMYNVAAVDVDRREVPQQRRYVSDPALLLSALLENELLGSADDLRRRLLAAAYLRPGPVPTRPAAMLPGQPDADPLTLTGDTARRVLAAAYADRREVPFQPSRQTLYFDAGPGSPPLTLAWGAGGNLWHLYNPRRPSRSWWPQGAVFAIQCSCTTARPSTGTTPRGSAGTVTRPSTGTTTRGSSGITVRPFTGTTPNPCC